LNGELAKQDENAAKLGKDKKALEETLKKTQSDLAAEEDKVNHLNKLKQKLEGQIDEVSYYQSSAVKLENFEKFSR
jgi:myosin heavy chain 6/7